MKMYKLFILAVFVCAIALYAQPVNMPHDHPGNLKEMLGLSESQAAKVEKIFKDSKQKIQSIREKEMAVIKSLRDSTKLVMDNSRREILKVLNKDQAEKFNQITSRRPEGELPPPPPGMHNMNFPPDMNQHNVPPPNMFNGNMPPAQSGHNFAPGDNGPVKQPCPDEDDLFPELRDFDMLF